jgi:drug/metabolite transporter (DMT)-like permease
MNVRSASGATLAFGAATISGVAIFVNGYGVHAVPDATVYTAAKNLVAALVLTLVAASVAGRRASGVVLPRTAKHAAGLAAVAVLGGSVPFVLFFEGLARASSTHAAFLQKTLVFWVVLLAVPLLGERLRAVHVAAVALILGGLVALDGGLRGFRFGDGEWLILAATLLWAVEVIVVKRLLHELPPLTVGLARMGGGVLLLIGWTAASGRLGVLTHLGWRGWLWSTVTGVILAGYVGIWFAALARARAVDVAAILTLGAVITAFLAAVVKGMALAPASLWGMGMLLAGASLVAAARNRGRAGPVVAG